MKTNKSINKAGTFSPYLVIAVAAFLAYLPVSTMLLTLKNDVLAIEYPVQHYISECLQNGKFPAWFNSWNMGFPLQSVLTWGVYSTPRMLTGFLVESNVYVLHVEFVFFIFASGCCMYKLLKTKFIADTRLSLLLACCYMLSGFTVASSQWLLYITGMVFIPLVIYCLLSLLEKPSLKYLLLLAVSYYLFLTNVHIYLTVVFTYLFITGLFIYFIRLIFTNDRSRQEKQKLFLFISCAAILTLLLCAAPLYYTAETISYLERNAPLINDSAFYQSNYLHPDALSSLLLPLSSVKTTHINTEGTVLNAYIGLLPLSVTAASLVINAKQKNSRAWWLLAASLIFLLISFGHLTPVRGWMNIFPGMAHFRHSGVLRVFFNFFFILYLAASFKNYRLEDLLRKESFERKSIIYSILLLALFSLAAVCFTISYLPAIWKGSFYETIKNIRNPELILINAAIQLFFTLVLLFTLFKTPRFFSFLLITELIVNTLLCIPFFTVSTYSPKEVNRILQSPKGFPVQQLPPSAIPASITDDRNNIWPNINTYRKEISNQVSMPGPLILQKMSTFLNDPLLKQTLNDKQIVFINDAAISPANNVRVTEQGPDRVIAEIVLAAPHEIVLQQGDFPGWTASYNGTVIPLLKNKQPFVSVMAPAGNGTLMFSFEKTGVRYSAIVLHIIVLIVILFYLVRKIRPQMNTNGPR